MKTLHQNVCRRILMIDDQNSIHDVFRTVLLRPAINNGALNDLESELFGTPSAMGNDETSTENVSQVV